MKEKNAIKQWLPFIIIAFVIVILACALIWKVLEYKFADPNATEGDASELSEDAGAISGYPKTMYFTEDTQIMDTTDPYTASWKEDYLYDTAVTIVGEDGEYYLVEVEKDKIGYAAKELLTEDAPVELVEGENHWFYERTGLSIDIQRYDEENLVYWVANIYTENPDEDINTAFAGGSYEECMETKKRTSVLAKQSDAIFAVNGDSVGFRQSGTKFQNPIVIRNGELCYEDDRDIGEMCALKDDGELVVFRPGELGSAQDMIDAGVTDTWWFDCALVKNGEVNQVLIESESAFENAPYTAIGQKDKNNFIFIAVDGRGSNDSEGVTYTGMARLMQQYGAQTAYELDGGGSTTIWFDGMVLNEPSDGRERPISDIVYVEK